MVPAYVDVHIGMLRLGGAGSASVCERLVGPGTVLEQARPRWPSQCHPADDGGISRLPPQGLIMIGTFMCFPRRIRRPVSMAQGCLLVVQCILGSAALQIGPRSALAATEPSASAAVEQGTGVALALPPSSPRRAWASGWPLDDQRPGDVSWRSGRRTADERPHGQCDVRGPEP